MNTIILKSMAWLKAREAREEGQTAIEYAVVVALVSLALAVSLIAFGGNIIDAAKAEVETYLPFGS